MIRKTMLHNDSGVISGNTVTGLAAVDPDCLSGKAAWRERCTRLAKEGTIMTRNRLFVVLVTSCLVFVWSGCGEDGPVKPEVDPGIYEPGTQWGGGDWPSLISPGFNESVIIGDPIPRFTAPYEGDFIPTLNAIQGKDWYLKITRPELLCTAWYAWQTYGYYWSYDLPKLTYHFNFDWTCFVSNSTLTNYDVSWPLTENKDLKLMQNGQWLTAQTLPTYTRSVGGNDYQIERRFELVPQPTLYLSMAHCWVQGSGTDADRTFPEGQIEITHRIKSGVQLSTTTTFTKTAGWSAGIDIKGISAGLNQTFEDVTSHTVSLEDEVETTETRSYDIPANEQWRYIQLYGVERYFFSDAEGTSWESPSLKTRSLGTIDNAVRNVLMIVKYRGGSTLPYCMEVLENAEIVSR